MCYIIVWFLNACHHAINNIKIKKQKQKIFLTGAIFNCQPHYIQFSTHLQRFAMQPKWENVAQCKIAEQPVEHIMVLQNMLLMDLCLELNQIRHLQLTWHDYQGYSNEKGNLNTAFSVTDYLTVLKVIVTCFWYCMYVHKRSHVPLAVMLGSV